APRSDKAGHPLLHCALLILLVVLAPLQARAFTQSELRATKAVMGSVDHGRWDEAHSIAEHAHFPLLEKLVEWLDLTRPASTADFGRFRHLTDQNKDWPQQALLKKHTEESIDDSVPAADVIAWFQRFPPVSLNGATHYIDALSAGGQKAAADSSARQF